MTVLPPLPVLSPGRYRHYKGKDYEVAFLARHSESEEVLVVYRPLYGAGEWWVRPFSMFIEKVEVEPGRWQPRFEFVGAV
ncbi:MAG TPA: DUF1653 domain-containing protein [Moraxellaceae bacterium]|nr:DUF1653 domain-containing protein [Moraxellaceae bacterium]